MISAELPDKDQYPRLHQLVLDKMVHGPCGVLNPKSVCMQKGECKRNFPKAFSDFTKLENSAFPEYKRRAPEYGGVVALKYRNNQAIEVDNSWVVPYNPYLLLRYRSHINIEYCHTVSSIKYLFKYQFKGEDKVTVENEADEIQKFSVQRYLSSCYAAWRLFEFKMTDIYPPVLQMIVHLENEQTVRYVPDDEGAEAALESFKNTHLTGYFLSNINHPEARELKFEDMPSKFRWDPAKKIWILRQQSLDTQVGRMITIHPSSGEKFFLRMLLKNIVGATSFENLRTVDGVVHETYKSACVALGLLQSDALWYDTMDEAVQVARPKAIRDLFCCIVKEGSPSDVAELLAKYDESMSEDFKHKRRLTQSHISVDRISELARNDMLIAFNEIFAIIGKDNAFYGLPMPDLNMADMNLNESTFNNDETAGEYHDAHVHLMTVQQRQIYDAITNDIDTGGGTIFALDAPGGAGKTFTCNLILCYVRMKGDIALAMAMSGIAALLLRQGETFHRGVGCPVPCMSDSSSKYALDSREAKRLKDAKLIVIDEASMMHKNMLDMLDRFLKALMNNNKPLGGKTILFMLDWRQQLPVIPGGSRGDIVSAAISRSQVWRSVKHLKLSQNMRVQRLISSGGDVDRIRELDEYSKWLLSIGNGTVPTVGNGLIEVPQHMVCQTPEELNGKVYDNFDTEFSDVNYLKDRLIMSPVNEIIQERNFNMVKRLPNEMIVSYSRDECVDDDHAVTYEVDTLNKLNPSGIPPHRLPLAKDCCIILIRNLNPKRGHVNGIRLKVTYVSKNLIRAVKLDGGPDAEVLIPRIPMVSDSTDFPAPFRRWQFPVLIGYYLTISRAQGQTLKKAGLDLPQSVFGHGQTYVGCSRTGDNKGMWIYANQSEFEGLSDQLDQTKHYTRNIVYPEVFAFAKERTLDHELSPPSAIAPDFFLP